MTEFFFVPYPEDRRVFVDGGPNCRTNRVQSVERGSHTFDLGEPVDYMPDTQSTFVGDTSIDRPQTIMFAPVAAVVAAVAGAVGATEAAAPPPARPARRRRKAGKKKTAKKKATKKTAKKTRRVKHR